MADNLAFPLGPIDWRMAGGASRRSPDVASQTHILRKMRRRKSTWAKRHAAATHSIP